LPSSSPILSATRTHNITYAVRDVTLVADEVARTGRAMLYLNIGDPNKFDFATPPHIVEAITRALRDNLNGYAPSSGTSEAREAVRRYAERKGLRGIQDLFITHGASEAIELCLTGLLEPGDNVLVPMPGYPLYTAILAKLQAVENPYYLKEEDNWQPDLDDIAGKVDARTKAIVVINPNNPTGANCSRELLEGLLEIARRHNLVLFADEIYDQLLFDGREHVSPAALDDKHPIITFNGLSKNYIGPGLRIGWGIVSGERSRWGDYLEGVNRMLRARLCANHPIMTAIPAALDGDQSHLADLNARLTRRRDLTVKMLNAIEGVSCVAPGGAFYAFPRIEIEDSDEEWVKGLIRKTGVVVVHGSGFGQKPGTHHFRVVFLPPEETLRRAYGQIGEYMKGRFI